MRNTAAAFCLMIGSLIPLLLQQQTNSAPSQNPPPSAAPQKNPIPDKFVNLQVLPKDITKGDLVNMMKQLSITFTVRCSYCHSVSDDLTQGSFDSDEKQTKVNARQLIKIILDTNKSNPNH